MKFVFKYIKEYYLTTTFSQKKYLVNYILSLIYYLINFHAYIHYIQLYMHTNQFFQFATITYFITSFDLYVSFCTQDQLLLTRNIERLSLGGHISMHIWINKIAVGSYMISQISYSCLSNLFFYIFSRQSHGMTIQ